MVEPVVDEVLVREAETEGVRVHVPVCDADPLPVIVAVMLVVAVPDNVWVWEGVLAEEGVIVPDPLIVGVPVRDPVLLTVPDPLAVIDAVPVRLAVCDGVDELVTVALCVAVTDCVPVRV